MFCVVYSFKVKLGKEEDFLKSWEELTKLIYLYEGSLGSRIHQSEDQNIYIAYAQWPSKSTWQNSGSKLPEEANEWRKMMKESCEKIETIHQLESKIDLLKDEVFSNS